MKGKASAAPTPYDTYAKGVATGAGGSAAGERAGRRGGFGSGPVPIAASGVAPGSATTGRASGLGSGLGSGLASGLASGLGSQIGGVIGSALSGGPANRFNTRTVRCCSCGEPFKVAPSARSASCTKCHRQVTTEDVKIKMIHWGGPIRCCGEVVVLRKARCLAKYILATGGVRVFGQCEALILSGGPVHLAAGSILRGGVVAPSVEIEPGAIVEGGAFRIPEDPIGRADAYVS